jgi:D-serine deaminase-like pyridoxal phosphate-dependent protein
MVELHRCLLDRYEIREGPGVARTASDRRSAPQCTWGRASSRCQSRQSAYLDLGRRNLLFDEGLLEPQVMRHTGPDSATTTYPLVGHELFDANSEHAFVSVLAGSPLRVGDAVRLGFSRPCTAFDNWSPIPVPDDASTQTPDVVDLMSHNI